MAEVISFESEAERDKHLAELGSWATTVLRAEIEAEGLEEHLLQELQNFPREFVLFLPVKVSMGLELGDAGRRERFNAIPMAISSFFTRARRKSDGSSLSVRFR